MRWRFALSLAAVSALPAQTPGTANAAKSRPVWRLEQEWSIGGAPTGPLAFDNSFGMSVFDDGRMVHYNPTAGRLYFLSAKGVPIVEVGNTGAGPGDFNQANGFALAPNGTVVVNDRANRRFSLFSSAGKFLSVTRISMSRSSLGGPWKAVFLRDGRLVERIQLLGGQGGSASRESEYLLWNPALTAADSLHLERCNPDATKDFTATHVPFLDAQGRTILQYRLYHLTPDSPMAIDPDGATWEGRNLESNEIVKRPIGSCTVTATIRLGGQRIPVSEKNRAETSEAAVAYAKRLTARPPVMPAKGSLGPWYRSLTVDDLGNVWVRRTLPDATEAVEIFDGNGRPLATLQGALGAVIRITNERAYVVRRDDDDVAYVVSMKIVKPPRDTR